MKDFVSNPDISESHREYRAVFDDFSLRALSLPDEAPQSVVGYWTVHAEIPYTTEAGEPAVLPLLDAELQENRCAGDYDVKAVLERRFGGEDVDSRTMRAVGAVSLFAVELTRADQYRIERSVSIIAERDGRTDKPVLDKIKETYGFIDGLDRSIERPVTPTMVYLLSVNYGAEIGEIVRTENQIRKSEDKN